MGSLVQLVLLHVVGSKAQVVPHHVVGSKALLEPRHELGSIHMTSHISCCVLLVSSLVSVVSSQPFSMPCVDRLMNLMKMMKKIPSHDVL